MMSAYIEPIKVLTLKDSGFTVNGPDGKESPIITTKIFPLLCSYPQIRKYFKECDVIHAYDAIPYGFIAALFSLGLKKKLIITAVGSGSIRPFYRKFMTPFAAWALRQADLVIPTSTYVDAEIKKVLPDLKTDVIPMGVDLPKHESAKDADLTTLKPYILSVGKVKSRKGYHVSIKVFAKLSQKFPQLKYVIVGTKGASYQRMIESLVSELELSDKVIFRSGISDGELTVLYKNAELFILMSQNIDHDVEGFGLVYLEAAAHGLPTIGSLDTGAIDAIEDGKNGYLVGQEDIDAAAKKITDLLSDSTLMQKFKKASVTFSRQMTWEIMVAKHVKLYRKILPSGSL